MKFDICILGSGFGGSLLAWCLAQAGRRVVLIDRSDHPRFAIGESSTPLADFLLERLADRWQLAGVHSLSRWGTWQAEHAELRVGLKRGFSYFAHAPGQPFWDTAEHSRSYLVAASSHAAVSDTHWMRSDVDAWLCRQAVRAGVHYAANQSLVSTTAIRHGWRVETQPVDSGASICFESRFVVDASGSGEVLGRGLGIERLDEQLRTRTSASFGHFRNVGSMSQWLEAHGVSTAADPFDADDAAQHHLLDGGWMWMLRFSEGTTSVGVVQSHSAARTILPNAGGWQSAEQRWAAWTRCVQSYPTLAELLSQAELIAPLGDSGPQLGGIPRISRLWSRAAGIVEAEVDLKAGSCDSLPAGWAMLPTTAGLVDPLHSTGIAHTLLGVTRLAELLAGSRPVDSAAQLQAYSQAVVEEVRWIDEIVSLCYAAADRSFDLFRAACGLYFVAAIHCERQLAETQDLPAGFLLHADENLRQLAQQLRCRLEELPLQAKKQTPPLSRQASRCYAVGEVNSAAEDALLHWWRRALEVWDDVGLLEPASHFRVARSAAPK